MSERRILDRRGKFWLSGLRIDVCGTRGLVVDWLNREKIGTWENGTFASGSLFAESPVVGVCF